MKKYEKKIFGYAYIVVIALGQSSCKIPKLYSIYKSDCSANGSAMPDLTLILVDSNNFTYKIPYLDTIHGNWKQKKNRIYLYSKDFETDTSKDLTMHKYTFGKNVDVYKVKGKRLYPVNGVFGKTCELLEEHEWDRYMYRSYHPNFWRKIRNQYRRIFHIKNDINWH